MSLVKTAGSWAIKTVGHLSLSIPLIRTASILFKWLLLLFCSAASAGELGANKFDLALQFLPPASTNSQGTDGLLYIRRAMAKKAIADASDAGLSFLRVSVTGYWPVNFGDRANDLTLWENSPLAFWAALDEMFDTLDRASVRLVPTFVWNLTQFPALGGDSLTTFLRSPQSRSRQLLAQFIKDFIGRYKQRKTILFYELTNEMNLAADLNLRRKCRYPNGGACVFDDFTTTDMIEFSRQLVQLIKSLDPSRRIASGYSIPRLSAGHLTRQPEFSSRGADWTPDTPDQFKQYLRTIHQPFDIISIHVYPSAENNRFGRPDGHQYELVADAASVANAVGKPLFVGEFGDTDKVTPFMAHLLNELVQNRVDYAAVWVWEFYQSATYRTHDTEPTRSSVEPGYSDELIAKLGDFARRLGDKKVPAAHIPPPPRVVLTWPLPCANVDRPLNLAAVASDGPRGVKSVLFSIDGKLLADVIAPPYYAHFDPSNYGKRLIEVKVQTITDSGASAEFKSAIRLNGADTSCVMPR